MVIPCIGGCTNINSCVFIKDYFLRCKCLCCYNIAIRFETCLKCGGKTDWRYPMTDNKKQIILDNSILNQYDFYCLRFDSNKNKVYYKNWW